MLKYSYLCKIARQYPNIRKLMVLLGLRTVKVTVEKFSEKRQKYSLPE